MGKALIGFILGLMVVPAFGAGVALTGHMAIEATVPPPRWERRLANLALDPAVERRAEGLASPVAATDSDLVKGLTLYRDHCATCHGDRGKPSRWGQHNFYPPVPQLAERGDHDPVPEIFVVVRDGIRYTGMAGWKDQIPEDDMWRVCQFLSRVKSLPPAVEARWKSKP